MPAMHLCKQGDGVVVEIRMIRNRRVGRKGDVVAVPADVADHYVALGDAELVGGAETATSEAGETATSDVHETATSEAGETAARGRKRK